MAGSFEHLLSEGWIGSLALRNRIVMTPMGSNLAEADGHCGECIQAYYEARARGGVGLVTVGVAAIAWPRGACNPNQVGISDDAFLPGLQALTERIHRHGACAAVQLQHAGKVATRDIVAGRPLWVPSAIPIQQGDLLTELTPEELHAFVGDYTKPGARMELHEMTKADIRELISLFADAAERASRAGFDAIEIHAAHGYLLSAFLSPHTNRREDEYGGTIENRARLMVEVIHAVRARVGRDLPVWVRLDAVEYRIPDGIRVEDAWRAAELAEEAGVDAIHVSAYADPTSGIAFTEAPLVHEPSGYVELAAAIKRHVDVPVIAVGRIEPDAAEEILRAGKADFIAMGRKLLADPELPRKLRAGKPEDVRPCIYCYRCVGEIFLNRPNRCAVNPATGREHEGVPRPARESRRVLVIGGGPAGLEAARVAALRGHEVTLWERDPYLGGALRFAMLIEPANARLLVWLERQLRKLPVEIRLGYAATPDRVRELAPDVVLVAVGAAHETPAIPGIEGPRVLSVDDLRALLAGGKREAGRKLPVAMRLAAALGRGLGLTRRLGWMRRLSRTWLPLGRRVAILGGDLVGVELAGFLAERGREVHVLEEAPQLARAMALPRRWRMLHELRERGVRLRTGVHVERITERGVRYREGDEPARLLEVDAVILASPAIPNRTLLDALRGVAPEIHELGDCSGVGYIEGALRDGAEIARTL